MCSGVSEQVVRNIQMFGMKQLTREAIMHNVTQESRACPFAFPPSKAASSRHTPAVATSAHAVAAGDILTSRPSASLRLLQPPPLANMPLWPWRPHAPPLLGDSPHSKLRTMLRSHAPHGPTTSRPSCPSASPTPLMKLTLLVPLMSTCCLASGPLRLAGSNASRPIKNVCFRDGSELDLAPLGQAGGGSSLETRGRCQLGPR